MWDLFWFVCWERCGRNKANWIICVLGLNTLIWERQKKEPKTLGLQATAQLPCEIAHHFQLGTYDSRGELQQIWAKSSDPHTHTHKTDAWIILLVCNDKQTVGMLENQKNRFELNKKRKKKFAIKNVGTPKQIAFTHTRTSFYVTRMGDHYYHHAQAKWIETFTGWTWTWKKRALSRVVQKKELDFHGTKTKRNPWGICILFVQVHPQRTYHSYFCQNVASSSPFILFHSS